jgi:formate-dependent nitrite reductase membrane component NrfD
MVSTLREAAHSTWVEGAGRAGLVAKGVSFVLVAILAIQVAAGAGGQPADRQGALDAVADEPLGWLPLLFLAVGFAGYGLWRFAQALFDRDREGSDVTGLGKRASDFAKGVLYVGLAAVSVSLVAGGDAGGSEEETATSRVLDLPLGRWIVGGVGLAIVGAGAWNGYRAVTGKFRDDLKTRRMSKAEDRWYTAIGVLGHLARAVVFALVGIFLLRAAYQYDPDEAIGLDGALAKLAGEAFGPFLLGAVAFGLLAYGLFCFVQARYREV